MKQARWLLGTVIGLCSSQAMGAKFLGVVEQTAPATPRVAPTATHFALELGVSGSQNRFDGRVRSHFRHDQTFDFPLTISTGQGETKSDSYNYSTIEAGLLWRWMHRPSRITPWVTFGPGSLQWTDKEGPKKSYRQVYGFGQLGINFPLTDRFHFSCWQELATYSNEGRPESLGGNQKTSRTVRYSFAAVF